MQHPDVNVDEAGMPLPSESEMVLLCLDYLRDLRRAYEPQDLLQAEGLHADYLSVAIYCLNRCFVQPPTLSTGRNDAWMDTVKKNPPAVSSLPVTPGRPEIFDDVSHFPDLKGITEEVLYTENPLEGEEDAEGAAAHDYAWYEYDDNHPSNAHRMYLLNGLASGPSCPGPLTLPELAATGLQTLQARSRALAEQEMIQSPLFEQFLQAVKGKGFFQENDSDANNASAAASEDPAERQRRKQLIYEDRFQKVVSKFRTKLASKAHTGELQGALWTPTADMIHQRRLDRIDAVRNPHLHNRNHYGEEKKQDDSSYQHMTSLVQRLAPTARAAPVAQAETKKATVATASSVASSAHPEDLEEAEKYKSLGNGHMQRKEYQEAAAAYTKALQLNPTGPNSHVYYSNRAAARLSQKQFHEAISDSERSLALKPDYGKAHARLGLAHFLLGNYRPAMEAYTVALKYEPDNASSKAYLEKAAKRLAAGGHPSDHTVGEIGHSFSVVSEWNKSSNNEAGTPVSATVDYAARQELRDAERHKGQGNAHMANREYKLAFEAYTAAIETSPAGPQAHVYYSNRAAALCYLERYPEAAQDARDALKLQPNYGKAFARLGLSLFFVKDYEGAIEAYTNALKHDPDNAASKSYLEKAKLKLARQQAEAVPEMDAHARRLLNDPGMQYMAQKALQDPQQLLDDPQIQEIARRAVDDPAIMEAVRVAPQVASPR